MRIIAGIFRGRQLFAPEGITTRPTTDRVREAWFNMIGPIDGPVLDLYAGTGALGFEALSRGATRAVFVEKDRQAIEAIKRNAKKLDVEERITILATTVEGCRTQVQGQGPFQLIVTDPPWTSIEECGLSLKRLIRPELLLAQGQLVLGYPKGKAISCGVTSGLKERKSRSWGRAAASFYVLEDQESKEPEDVNLDAFEADEHEHL
ncbi:MAG: 16S rRNA (guanine(966)-N(2))-methyltransferase RsmD [Polyangiaceae bacterium]|nr:16S rRNA (guanine(966)-N(2))-methyltransferase RsmD [Polyangiaceae bacterium]